MTNGIKRNIWKIILTIFLSLNLITTSLIIVFTIKKDTIYPVPVDREIESYEELARIADYLVKNGKLKSHSFAFDYEGDEFDIRYGVGAWGAKQNATDIIDLLSPRKCYAQIKGCIIVKDYECGCPDEYSQTGDCFVRIQVSPVVEKSDCVIIYDSLISSKKDFPDIKDRSLLAVKECNADGSNVEYAKQYDLIYDGTPILRISTCIELDDKMISLFVDHLVVYEASI